MTVVLLKQVHIVSTVLDECRMDRRLFGFECLQIFHNYGFTEL